MKRSLGSLVVGLVILVGALGFASDNANAISGAQANVGNGKCWENSAGQCYHWARTAPGLSLAVENDLSGAWAPYYSQALADWSFTADPPVTALIDPVTLALTAQNSLATSSNCQRIPGKVRMCDRKYGFNGWLGLASIWVASDGQHITAGTVKLNDSYFQSSTYNTAAWRNLVSCQELAHTIGLGHEDETFTNANLNSCMDYTNSPGSNQSPSSDDLLTLANLYASADASSTVSSPGLTGGSRGLGADDGEDAVPPGARPADGDVFVKHLPDGTTLITHVFWAGRGHPR